MGFAEEHEKWLEGHLRKRKGEQKSRLKRGHGHGERLFLEQVWWPIFGNFEHLHPEYEVVDWHGRPYFIDLVWHRGQSKFAFEIKGYGPHVQNTDRIRYRRELNREIFLQVLGYRVVSVPFDELEEKPQFIVSLLQSLIAPYWGAGTFEQSLSLLEREVLLAAVRSGKSIRPMDLIREFQIDGRTAVKYLKMLCDKGKLRPIVAGKGVRIVRYEPIRSILDPWIW
ncbi:hypothetical protein I6N90_20225 [Paenibacillus sp. GSMTC-2017]|uniref:hypothetical protein n=1 Tax=Paenibacillus sp. GSMTC-2017 TaxID=2794350 RepID=UPI0018D6141D|nr:hypothetical protein [Paenibacillus sp. GSMTC-2017]MBH5320135.1 hypothetical protein [Paenibacillus sp. GSMTC-2017]